MRFTLDTGTSVLSKAKRGTLSNKYSACRLLCVAYLIFEGEILSHLLLCCSDLGQHLGRCIQMHPVLQRVSKASSIHGSTRYTRMASKMVVRSRRRYTERVRESYDRIQHCDLNMDKQVVLAEIPQVG